MGHDAATLVVMPPEPNAESATLADLQTRVNAAPFVPFRIATSNGKTYEVTTSDRITIMRLSHRVRVVYDNHAAAYINLAQITAIEPPAPPAKP